MRENPTPFERILWLQLRASRLAGLKFRRRTVIDDMIVDVVRPAIGPVVETNGDMHDAVAGARRDAGPGERGFRVLRFADADVARNRTGVPEAILSAAAASHACFTHAPVPALEKERDS